jgi:hypothetical protein
MPVSLKLKLGKRLYSKRVNQETTRYLESCPRSDLPAGSLNYISSRLPISDSVKRFEVINANSLEAIDHTLSCQGQAQAK